MVVMDGMDSWAGMFCYEQDWLDAEMDKSRILGESATMVSATV